MLLLFVTVICLSLCTDNRTRGKKGNPSGGVSQWQKCSVFLRNTHQSTTSFLSVTKAFIDAGFRRLAGSNGEVMNWLTGSLIYLFMERSLNWIGQPNDWILISESISPCLLNYPNSFPRCSRWQGETVSTGGAHTFTGSQAVTCSGIWNVNNPSICSVFYIIPRNLKLRNLLHLNVQQICVRAGITWRPPDFQGIVIDFNAIYLRMIKNATL